MKRLVLCLACLPGLLAAAPLEYERDIMPIFEKKCYDCHSAEENVKGGLRLDDPEHFLKRFAKNDVVIPGDWDASYLFVTVTRPREDKHAMPPKDKGEALTPEEILKVANWIHEGARVGREKGERGDSKFKPDTILRFRDGVLVPEQFEAKAEEKPRTWTNKEGKEIVATFKGVESGNALLVTEDGRTFRYPLEKLSDESRALIKSLGGGSEE